MALRFPSPNADALGRNGYAERLIRTLKEEEVNINDYQSITEARDRIGHFITQVYHQKRPHSALGYLTPMEFSTTNLILTLRNCGLNKRMHFTPLYSAILLKMVHVQC